MNKSLMFLLLSITVAACTTLKPIEFRSVDNFTITDLPASPKISADLNFFNPNGLGVKLKNFQLGFSVNQTELTSVEQNKVSNWHSNSSFTIPLSASVSLPELAIAIPQIVSRVKNKSELPVSLQGKITLKKFIFSKTFPINVNSSVNIANLHF